MVISLLGLGAGNRLAPLLHSVDANRLPLHGANWLPVPDAPFSAYLRMYVPRQEALDGTWTPPPIQRRY